MRSDVFFQDHPKEWEFNTDINYNTRVVKFLLSFLRSLLSDGHLSMVPNAMRH
jgi:hypothetical protein